MAMDSRTKTSASGDREPQRAIVIGGGLGGLTAAACLAAKGLNVQLFEKNQRLGGKLNVLTQDGFTFDLGPSILTLPQVFRDTFECARRNMDDYLTIQSVRPHWRNFFEDGTVLDLDPDPAVMREELQKAGPGLAQEYQSFLDYSRQQYELIEPAYFRQGLETVPQLLNHYKHRVLKLSSLTTMDRAVRRRLSNQYLRDIFDFFIKYVGSSATRAPGFMNLLPHIQFGYGLWYVRGGMYNLAAGLERLLDDLGVQVHTNTEVTRILTRDGQATGIEAGNEVFDAEWVISNMEVIPAYKNLLDENDQFMRKLDKFEPACSGLVIHLGVNRRYEQLAHHNFFYSANQREHFRSVFEKKELPDDPTLYVVAPARTNPEVAPEGQDNIKVLPHIPYLNDNHPYTHDDYMQLKDRVLQKLEHMGLVDLRKHVVSEHIWTPHDIERMYYSNGGSIYGVVSDLWKNYALKAPKQSNKYDNLYFVGGSTNPGGGMPMVSLSGQLTARAITRRLCPESQPEKE